MADPANAEAVPQNREGTGSDVGPGKPPVETRFEKGRSGNPSGRPRGLARKVREVLGDDDGETIARFWGAVMSGVLVSTIPEIQADGTTVEKRVVETVSMSDRIAVSKLLAERGWGKPPAYAPIEDEDPLDLAERETAEIAESFDRRLDELAERRAQKTAAAE